MNKLQLSMLLQNQIMEIRSGMKLTRNVNGFKRYFKETVGLSKRASNVQVLQTIGYIYQDNGIGKEFNDRITKFNMQEHGINLVDESPLAELN